MVKHPLCGLIPLKVILRESEATKNFFEDILKEVIIVEGKYTIVIKCCTVQEVK